MTAGVNDELTDSPSIQGQSGAREFGKLWPFLKYSFIAAILAEIALAGSNILALNFFRRMSASGGEIDERLVGAAANIGLHQGVTGSAYLIAFICAAIAYCRFYYRAVKNLHAVNAAGVRTTPFWAVGTFFIPIVNLWKPLGAVRQIWKATFDPVSAAVSVPAMIGWWWFFWIVAGVLGNASTRLAWRSGGLLGEIGDLDMYMGSFAIDVLSAPPSIASALLVLDFSKRILIGQRTNILKTA